MSAAGPDTHVTRARLLRGGVGAGLALACGGGYGAWRLLEPRGHASSLAVAASGPGVHHSDSRSDLRAPTIEPGVHRFYSRPDLRPPTVTVLRDRNALSRDLFFLTPMTGPGQRGTLIVGRDGEPVWFRRAAIDVANLNVSTYKGAPVLTWWRGKFDKGGVGDGEYVVADAHYRTVARFGPGLGYHGDLHDFVLTPQGTALITVQRTVRADLRSVGGARQGEVIDVGFQEIDVASGDVLLHWSSLAHVSLAESYMPAAKRGPYDFMHLNSLDIGPDGTILLSARYTWALYRVDRRSGAILWRLGGKRSSFSVPAPAAFAWQHDARWLNQSTITLFDDGAGPISRSEPQSRGIVLAVDADQRRVRLARSYTHTPGLLAASMGSMQVDPEGDVVIGWGDQPYFSSYAADGSVQFDARLPHGGSSYRSLSHPWVGQPLDAPAIAASSSGGDRVSVSWNGATEVRSWQLQTGPSPDRLGIAQTVPKAGFETSLEIVGKPRFAAAVALDQTGRPLGISPTISI